MLLTLPLAFVRRLPARWWLALLVASLCAPLPWLSGWQMLEKRGFDGLTVLTAPGTTPLPIVLVAIDDASLAEVKAPWPWPRSLHARLIDELKAAGAAVIAFDVLFSQPTRAEEDAALAAAIARAGNVVLATGLVQQETAAGTLWARQEPLPQLIAAGAQTGVVNLNFDADMVMRQLPTDGEAFWRRILVRLRQALPEQELPGLAPAGGLIRYVGPPGTLPTLPYHLALALDKHVAPGELQDAVVLVGRATRAATDIGLAQADLFATPFTRLRGELSPGTEIHANALDSVIRQQTLRPVPPGVQLALIVLFALAGALALGQRRPTLAYGALLLLLLLPPLVAWGLFVHAQWWLPVGALMLVPLLLLGGHLGHNALRAHRERARVQRMFALYVPPDVVQALIDRPEAVRLGGETRRLTVLFCDLRGFTTLSTTLPPADITRILNRYFTRMTRAIFAHGGTVDKFIGDAIMAFWGAPLPDAEQERHALAAARALAAALATLNKELIAEGHPPLRIGIGLNSGEALVGNLGSEERMSYTAIGDSVNVASRLEAATKAVGVEILLSNEVTAGLSDDERAGLRPLASLRVPGRAQPVAVFSPCDDESLIAATQAALAALADREAALAAWQRVATLAPDDALARHALNTLADDDWDGVLAVHK